jgi:predicted exporter
VALAVWLALVALAALIAARAHYTADLSAFLPRAPTAMQRLLVDQLRNGAASRLLLMDIRGGDAAARAGLSRATADALRRDPQFTAVENGGPAAADRGFLFQHRYLLSDAVDPARFAAAGLEAAIRASLEELSLPAGLLMKPLLAHDPTGEMLAIVDRLDRGAAPRTADGVWVSRDAARALLLVQTRADGSDTDAQARAITAVRAAFTAAAAKAAVPGMQLRMTGPGVFAVTARDTIKHEAMRLSVLSLSLIVLLLLAVYRSVGAVLLGLLPVASGALAGIAAVSVGYGAVHGITLGFGITLIGESVDYPIYFLIQSGIGIQSRVGGDPGAWRRLLWPTIRLGVLTSVCGFASLLPSGFPGLAQLGLYSIAGLMAAALVTRFVLPQLTPPGLAVRDVAPLGDAAAAAAARLAAAAPAAACAVLVLAAAVLFQHRGALWNRDLAALSPVPAAGQALDAELRAQLGAADVSHLVVVQGPDLEAVLQRAERAAPALAQLTAAGVIGGFDSPAIYLPSRATQSARRASLPPPPVLRERLARATAALPLRAGALEPFLEDVEAARNSPLLGPADLAGTSPGAAFGALVLRYEDRWYALLPLLGGIDIGRVRAALEAADPGETRILDLKGESDALYSGYLAEAARLSLAGIAAIVTLLLVALRSPARVLRVLGPLLLAVLAVAAGLAAAGRQFNILHLIGMLLIVAVGSNYALFFDHLALHGPLRDARRDGGILASLLVANAATVIGFGVLAFSKVPVLSALGETVAPGAFLALLFAALLARHTRNLSE